MVRLYSIVSWCVQVFSDITSILGLKKYPKLTFQELESAYWFLSYGKVIFHCQLMCTVPSQVDWAWKTTPNSPMKHQNLPIGSWVIVRLSSIVSWCVQCHHERTGLKNYPKLTLEASESAYWFLSYGKIIFHCQLMCTVTSWVDLALKTTQKWLLKHQNWPTGSKVTVKNLKIWGNLPS